MNRALSELPQWFVPITNLRLYSVAALHTSLSRRKYEIDTRYNRLRLA
jgi:hypothetical protein